MKHQLLSGVITLFSLFAATALVGCYTQLGTVRSGDDSDYGYGRDNAAQSDTGYQQYDDSTVTQGNDEYNNDYLYDRNRVGFSYYYPSVFIGAGYYDPWYYGRFGWYSYYDPFLCGTADPWLYAGGYYPPYWYSYPGYYGGYYLNPYNGGGRFYGSTRTFGNTRGGAGIRTVGGVGGGSGVYPTPVRGNDLPVGYRSNGASGRGAATPSPTPKVSTGKRGSGQGVRSGSRSGTVGRGGNTRSGKGRVHVYHPNPGAPPAAHPAAPRGNSGGERGGSGGRSYSPPPSAPSHAPSAPSSGGGSRSGSGDRGGNRR